MHESRRIDQEPSFRKTTEQVREYARSLGFDAIGIADADEPLDVDHARYEEFVAEGRHGDMAYLANHAEVRKRLDTEAILLCAKSVICVGRVYARKEEEGPSGIVGGIAKYARGRDYHGFLKKLLRKLAAFVETLVPGARARALCDIEPVLERAWAMRAGLGFVGKNGLVITPGLGSFQMLGEVVTTCELVADTPMTERCGSCTRCLDVCPTQAFVAPFKLDPRKCISYLTIEAKTAPAEELRAGVGEHLFGCDDCQDVCPFNRTASPPLERTQEFAPLPQWQRVTLEDLVKMDDAGFEAVTPGSPLRRARRSGLARNAALVAANRLASGKGDDADERCLKVAEAHEDPSVREVAAWGARRIAPGTSGA